MATENSIMNAFFSGVNSILAGVRYSKLREAIESRNYDEAVRAIDVDNAAFDKLRALLVETYASGGVDAITGTRWPVNVRWDSATPQAEYYARNVVAEHINKIAEDIKSSIQWTIGDGVAFGRSNNKIALDIVGKMGKSGKREGGIVGLNKNQTEWVANARKYLESGKYSSWEKLGLRDRRYKFSQENPPTKEQIDRAVQSYSNKLLKSRGLMIARTERGLAVNMGTIEGYRQAADKVGIPLSALIKEWRHNGFHKHERINHLIANGQKVVGLNTPFNIGGYYPQHPHDVNLPASETINCSCRVRVRVPKNWRSYVGQK